MDMQGKPIGGPSAATKHTSDPAAQQSPIQEPTGPVASDSLAAESSAFAANPNATPSDVPGHKSTLATTDTSAARALDAAPDATAREEQAAWSEAANLRGPGGVKYAEALGGQPEFGGTVSEQGYAGGPSGAGSGAGSSRAAGSTGGGAAAGSGAAGSTAKGRSTGSTSTGGATGNSTGGSTGGSAGGSGGTSGGAQRDAAPGYVASVVRGGDGKPKGANLTEGGFEGEAQNNDYEIGSEKDPGRAALQGFQASNARAAGDVGATQKNFDGGSREYESLKRDEQA